jgi:hypothetical protein
MATNSRALPLPSFLDRPERCLRCAYDLEGIRDPVCPECGFLYDDTAVGIVIYGVARNEPGPTWRRVVWILLAVLTFLYFQLVVVLFMFRPIIAGVVLLTILAGIVAMLMTGTSRKRGIERVTFTRAGFGREPYRAKVDKTDNDHEIPLMSDALEFVEWGEGVRIGVQHTRVSSVWQRIRIRAYPDSGRPKLLLDMGTRCRDERVGALVEIIETLGRGERFDPDTYADPERGTLGAQGDDSWRAPEYPDA